MGLINGKLYVAGGVDGSGSTMVALDVYDPATNSWQTKAAMPTPRRGAAGAVVNNSLYVIGGRDDSGVYLGTVEAYNAANNIWVRKSSLPQASSGLAAPVQDGLIFAIGGRNGGDPVREQPGVLAIRDRQPYLTEILEPVSACRTSWSSTGNPGDPPNIRPFARSRPTRASQRRK